MREQPPPTTPAPSGRPHGERVLAYAQMLMRTKGYGWLKALATAASLLAPDGQRTA